MVTIDIKENIRFFKPNDPYYYEVDNLPLIDLLNNDKILRDEINFILAANSNYASEAYVQNNIQAAIGDAGEVDIDGEGGIIPTNIIAWINQQNFLTETATNLGDLLDVDLTSTPPSEGNVLRYDTVNNNNQWVAGPSQGRIQYLDERVFIIGHERTAGNSDTPASHMLGSDREPNSNISDKVQPARIDVYDPVTLTGTPFTTYPGYSYKGSGAIGHTTFTWVRTFAQLKLPENAKRIHIQWGVKSFASETASDHSTDKMWLLYHGHAAYVPPYVISNPGNQRHGFEDGTTLGLELIFGDYLERISYSTNNWQTKQGQYCINYTLPLTNPTTTDVTPTNDNTGANVTAQSFVKNTTLPGNCLYITIPHYGANNPSNIYLYIYGYEAWDD